ncbi:alpha/beta fold hydrolase [Zobellia roscoffensis]|uniref:alpha/beta fold hydrolase n=1 Tax=Zobellia roscoffensis TaxID=2779508 RepID=UPI001D0401FD|nr:alpha/beta hydrolase [Zobellia roscoffensis]
MLEKKVDKKSLSCCELTIAYHFMFPLYKVSNTLYDDKKSSSEPITVIFLHGNSLSSLVWSNQLSSALFEKIPLVALDLPGHGKSPEHHSYAFSDLLKILKENIEVYEKVIIVGHSLGGHLAIELLPNLNNCLGLFIIGAPPIKKPVNTAETFKPDPRMGLLFQNELSHNNVDSLLEMLGADKIEGPIDFRTLIKATKPEFRQALGASLARGELADETDILRKTTKPVALVVGSEDKLVNADYLKGLSIPFLWRGSVQTIENSAHIPQLDASIKFNALLIAFINSVENG